ncbi:MAG: hypothetical protein ABH805_02035 [Candidatus Nealsonbacteria bacterium]
MKKILLIALALFVPITVSGAVASDFTINNQSMYDVPPGSSKVLILDLSLPETLQSIRIDNAGTAEQRDISKISVFEDGASSGWDGDEKEIVNRSTTPFFDTILLGTFSSKRIFVTVNIASTAVSYRTIKPKFKLDSLVFVSGGTGPTDEELLGLERKIVAGASQPTAPVAPLPGTPEILSSTAIRWHFTDLSNNEFGFKILDGNLKTIVKQEEANLTYLDETGLLPSTAYSGRRVVTFNDRGESFVSLIFPEVVTLAKEMIEEPVVEEPVVEEPVEEIPPVVETPVVEEPVVEEPVTETPVVEEPVIKEPVDDSIKEPIENVEETKEVEEIQESSKENVIEKPSLLEIIRVKIFGIREGVRNLFNQLFNLFKR